jgi:hypothetical protein
VVFTFPSAVFYILDTIFFQNTYIIIKISTCWEIRPYNQFSGLYLGKYPPPGGNIGRCHLGEKIWKGEGKKGENVKEKGRKRKEKERKGKENKKRESKRVK